jgi:hypothetical protein
MRPANLPLHLPWAMLGARCLASRLPCLATGCARDLSPALAPASGFRSHADPRLPKPEASGFRCLARSLGRGFRSFTGHKGCGLGAFAVSATLPIGQVLSLSGDFASLRSLNGADLPLAEASCMPSPDRRVDRRHRHPWDKNSGNFRALRPSVPVVLFPEDRFKLRLNRRSGNIGQAWFSTSGDLACGHEWISQRFVAFIANRTDCGNETAVKLSRYRPRDAAASTTTRFSTAGRPPQASRLRRDSSRRRRPFSLMKPSASFWS